MLLLYMWLCTSTDPARAIYHNTWFTSLNMTSKAVLHSKRSLGSVRHTSGALASSLIRLHPCRVACPTLHATAEIAPENTDNSEQQLHCKPSMVHTSSHLDPSGWPNSRVPPSVPDEQQQQQRANQPQQSHQWVVFRQCTMLAAAALAAAPLILVLDIAENACLAICQAKQYARLTQQAAAKPCKDGSRTPTAAPPASRQQQQQRQQQPRAAAGSPASRATLSCMTMPQEAHGGTGMGHAHTYADVHSTTASFSTTESTGHSSYGVNRQIKVSGSDARPPVLDLLPPWTPMALTLLPVPALVLRHFGDSAVLWQLCFAAASLLVQGYVNMLLVVMQRGKKRTTMPPELNGMQPVAPTAAVAAAAAADISSVEGACPRQKEQQQQHIRAANKTTVLASSSSSSIAFKLQQSSHGWWRESNSCTCGTDSSISNSSSRTSTMTIVTSALFRMVQVLGDGFRVWCLASACWLIVHQQSPAMASAWSACTVMLQQVLSSSSTGPGAPQITGAAAAAAWQLQQLFVGGLWLSVDMGLCIAAISMYALALAARVLHSVNDVV